MTYEEAIKLLNSMAIYHFDKYTANAIDTAINALEKQIPKKPIEKFAFSDDIGAGLCPFCNEGVNEEMNFCSYCGQALDWKES